MTSASQHELEKEVRITPDGAARVILRGQLDAQTVGGCWDDLQKLRVAAISTLEVDATGLRFCDSAGLALLRYLDSRRMAPQALHRRRLGGVSSAPWWIEHPTFADGLPIPPIRACKVLVRFAARFSAAFRRY